MSVMDWAYTLTDWMMSILYATVSISAVILVGIWIYYSGKAFYNYVKGG